MYIKLNLLPENYEMSQHLALSPWKSGAMKQFRIEARENPVKNLNTILHGIFGKYRSKFPGGLSVFIKVAF